MVNKFLLLLVGTLATFVYACSSFGGSSSSPEISTGSLADSAVHSEIAKDFEMSSDLKSARLTFSVIMLSEMVLEADQAGPTVQNFGRYSVVLTALEPDPAKGPMADPEETIAILAVVQPGR